ncbi:MAG TPA: hypothetical protein VL172_03025 [Kofleriaceae bacterium]|jgi:hypothetical protein|nr:hypothetical protein [Kofleriaceae bacterium]
MKRSLVIAFLTAACGGGEPADVAGDYTIALTNQDNGCGFANWTEGNTSTGVPVVIGQGEGDAADEATATVNGAAGIYLDAVLGARVYTGSVDGSHLDLTLHGTNSATQAQCTYTVNSTIDADLDGDVLRGEILYHTSTNGSPDCGTLEGCESRQDFNGTRPPT